MPGIRAALQAPAKVKFDVVQVKPRLSAEEQERNKRRARDLYLVAVEDLGGGDVQGAVMHLQLAIAYDDDTSLYQDLLGQLRKRQQGNGDG
jgi:hypothetical protein